MNEKSNGPKIEDIDNLFSNIESEIKKLTSDDIYIFSWSFIYEENN